LNWDYPFVEEGDLRENDLFELDQSILVSLVVVLSSEYPFLEFYREAYLVKFEVFLQVQELQVKLNFEGEHYLFPILKVKLKVLAEAMEKQNHLSLLT
jgi:hypothetical protein